MGPAHTRGSGAWDGSEPISPVGPTQAGQVKDSCSPLQAAGETAGTDGAPRAGGSGQMGLLCLAQGCFCTLVLSSSD